MKSKCASLLGSTIGLLVAAFFLCSCAAPQSAADRQPPPASIPIAPMSDPLTVENAVAVQLEKKELKPGLVAWYYREFFKRHLKHLPKKESFPGRKGEPILDLNHQFGKNEVYKSGSNRGVGMRMEGFLYLEDEGTYIFQALSNDGVIIEIDGKILISDPQQHADRLSAKGTLVIEKPGYYPLTVEYFQRKGTASLQLFWQTPDAADMTIVPPETYWHN